MLFVSLAEVDGDDGVIPALTEAAGITLAADHGKPGSPEAEARLFKALSDRDVLVVFDNCEHLLDPVAALVDEILDRCPLIRVLTTTRESLGVADERVWRVPAPDDDTAVALPGACPSNHSASAGRLRISRRPPSHRPKQGAFDVASL